MLKVLSINQYTKQPS